MDLYDLKEKLSRHSRKEADSDFLPSSFKVCWDMIIARGPSLGVLLAQIGEKREKERERERVCP